jgi:polyhydroxyalkanoate synthesis regulator phasin
MNGDGMEITKGTGAQAFETAIQQKAKDAYTQAKAGGKMNKREARDLRRALKREAQRQMDSLRSDIGGKISIALAGMDANLKKDIGKQKELLDASVAGSSTTFKQVDERISLLSGVTSEAIAQAVERIAKMERWAKNMRWIVGSGFLATAAGLTWLSIRLGIW